MSDSQRFEAARAAFDKGAWSDAYAWFRTADARTPLSPDDLDRLATAAYLIGEDAESLQARTRAHTAFLESGEKIRAAGSAFWLAFVMMDTAAQRSQAAGWLARARRLIDEANQPCVEQGWLLCAAAFQRVVQGDVASAHAVFAEAAEVGARFHNADLIALARQGQGRTLLAMNRTADGLLLLDEVMIAVTGGEITPMVAGVVYCSVISACHDLFDMRRAQEWTAAFHRWCASHPDLIPFRGHCLIRHSELLQLHGAWQEALDEARQVCARLTAPPPETGAAYYRLGELHRLRGEFADAEEAYRLASQAGRNPYPGVALLRFGNGQLDAADASIRLGLHEVRDQRARVPLLSAAVEIMLAKGDAAGARAACDELTELAGQRDSPFLRAISSQASGTVALAAGGAATALRSFHSALTAWQELSAPYELARLRVSIGLAYRQVGDREGAQLEFDAAHDVFDRLGAAPDAARVAALTPQAADLGGGLTGREVEVLRLIATGVTNRTIATRLGISEKTVARHISNIFTKLDLPSRAAATAYAYEHKLL